MEDPILRTTEDVCLIAVAHFSFIRTFTPFDF